MKKTHDPLVFTAARDYDGDAAESWAAAIAAGPRDRVREAQARALLAALAGRPEALRIVEAVFGFDGAPRTIGEVADLFNRSVEDVQASFNRALRIMRAAAAEARPRTRGRR